MLSSILIRFDSGEQGTFGRLFLHGLSLFTVEQPWKDNRPSFSSIPAGEYICVWRRSPKYGWCYHVQDVEGRTHILIHPGNFGGDRELGYRSDTLGCILLTKKMGALSITQKGKRIVQRAGLVSRPAVRAFHRLMNKQDFKLTIYDAFAEAA